MKRDLIIFIVLICIAVGIFLGLFLLLDKKENKIEEKTDLKEMVSLCYFYSNKTESGLYDKTWLRLNIEGENVTGELNNYPAEKDSKVGSFSGTVGPLDQQSMGRTANLWWDYLAEGMKFKEELLIEFGDGSASALYGEMEDRGDGVYIYKDKTQMVFGQSLSQISCEDFDEINIVEKYIKDNIKTIANNKPVLGGSWHVISIFVNHTLNQGEVRYEDGHIESNAEFKYEFNQSTKDVVIKEFKIKK